MVGSAVELFVDEIRVVLGDLSTDVESLFQFGLRALFENLRSQHLVAAVPAVVLLGNLLLFLKGKREKFLSVLHHGLLLLQGHGVTNNLEEAIVKTAVADLIHNLLLLRWIFRVECCMKKPV